MKTVKIGSVEVGAGKPKVIVPIVARTREGILAKAREIRSINADLVEWRADFYYDVLSVDDTVETGKLLAEALGDKPFLFTFRTKEQGGEKEIDPALYTELNRRMATEGNASCVDVEMFSGDELVLENLRLIHEAGIPVIGSNHEFDHTPETEEMIRRLRRMQELGADILKIAVMPKTRTDVARLLLATVEMYENYTDRPLITMSMGALGMITRCSGELFGSALTFGAVGDVSAPGQLPVGKLTDVLNLFHTIGNPAE